MPIRILVADDEPDLEHLIRQKFRKRIRENDYEFIFAQNGAEALEKISSNDNINLILTDINMPVMDGLTLLSKISELENRQMRSVIVSAYGDMDNIRIAMNRGAYDFVTKPIDLNDLEITVEKSLKEIEIYRKAMMNQNKLIAIQQELDIATSIQTSILPKIFPPFPNRKDFDIYAEMITAKEVGGDFYDFFLIDKNRVGVIIGDVSGKGIAAALLMAVTKTLLKATALKGIPTDNVLTEVNNILADDSPSNMFVTVFYGVLDTRNGAFEYCNAGHNPPYLISSTGVVKPIENIGGLIVGAMRDVEYESNVIMVIPGDSLFFYTDGVTEAMNKNEEEFGEERLIKCLSEKHDLETNQQVFNVVNEVHKYSEGIEQSDDITCLTLKYFKK